MTYHLKRIVPLTVFFFLLFKAFPALGIEIGRPELGLFLLLVATFFVDIELFTRVCMRNRHRAPVLSKVAQGSLCLALGMTLVVISRYAHGHEQTPFVLIVLFVAVVGFLASAIGIYSDRLRARQSLCLSF